MDERCRREIEDLHRFFEDWFTGQIPNDELTFARLDQVLAEGFQIITPAGIALEKDELLERLRPAHGAHADKDFLIETQSVQVRFVEPLVCLVTYQEWQYFGNNVLNGRLSSAWFRESAGAPNGIEWLHVHEVGLDEAH